MTMSFMAELYLASERYTPALGRLLVDALLATGFSFEEEPGSGSMVYNGEIDDYQLGVPVATTLAALDRVGSWATTLFREIHGWQRPLDMWLEIDRSVPGSGPPLTLVNLSVRRSDIGLITRNPIVSRQFWSWTMLAAGILQPIYGWAGPDIGLVDPTPVQPDLVARGALLPIEWMNIYGPGYIERLGLERLLVTPDAQVDVTAAGAVVVTLGPYPSLALPKAAAAARHLKLPSHMGDDPGERQL